MRVAASVIGALLMAVAACSGGATTSTTRDQPETTTSTVATTSTSETPASTIGLAFDASTGPAPTEPASPVAPQTPDTSTPRLVVPEGFRPGVLATDFHGGYIAIDISTGESIQFTAKDVGVLGSPVAGTLLPDGVVVISDLISEGGYGSQANVYDNGLTQMPTVLRPVFSTSPSWLVPTPDPRFVWFAEAQPPWRIELHSVVDQSVVAESSIDLGENMELHPVGATTDGLIFHTFVYEDLGEGPTPIIKSGTLFLIDSDGGNRHLGGGSALTVGPNALYLYKREESAPTLIEVRTDTGDRREISNRRWNTPTFSADTGETFDQWSAVNPSGTKILLRWDDSGVVVLDLQTMEIESLPSTRFSLAAWTEDDEIVLISERSVQTPNADTSLSTVAAIPEGFYVLDAGQ